MTNDTKLKHCLDQLAEGYDARFLDSDPVGLVHGYNTPVDREVAGFVVSVLAYGGATQIRKSAQESLSCAGKSPADFAQNLSPKKALEMFHTFRHRWTTGNEIAFIFWVLGKILREYGSIGALAISLNNPLEHTIEGLMTRFSEWIIGQYSERFHHSLSCTDISYLIPSPARGSACKRLALYFRWMVRGPDGIDFGIWKGISPSRLLIPLDRHMARMAGLLGLTRRLSVNWQMVLDITESLRSLDPHDPVRYDFALVRPGILGECTPSMKGDCLSCVLRVVCREST